MKLLRSLYGCLLREARQLKSSSSVFWLFPANDIPQWGHGHMCDNAATNFKNFLPDVPIAFTSPSAKNERDPVLPGRLLNISGVDTIIQPAGGLYLDAIQLRNIFRLVFRAHPTKHTEERQSVKDKRMQKNIARAFDAIRTIRDGNLRFSKDCVSVATTNGVRVEVNSLFVYTNMEVGETISGKNPIRWYFTYRVRIENTSDQTISLTGRHLVFQDLVTPGVQPVIVPRLSPGVVGLHPILSPGDSFIYASGIDLSSALGVLSGSFQMTVIKPKEGNKQQEIFDAILLPVTFKGPQDIKHT